ncbi:YutD-like domain-containing protein [Fructobacillus americanaquae]|uniref:YutD-like domain-containing protein n=1 Tax=Fructobacillus americanaquae TaxID=2940302 RepID=UPI003B84AD08
MNHESLKERTITQQAEREKEFQVSVFGDEITIDGLKLTLQENFKDAFDASKLAIRYTPLLKQYDYIVGDISADQLRLRGFYQDDREVTADQKISALADYLYEYVNFGAPYFVLSNATHSFRPVKVHDFLADWEAANPKKPVRKPSRSKKPVTSRKPAKVTNGRNQRPSNRGGQNGEQRQNETGSAKRGSSGNSSKRKNHQHRFKKIEQKTNKTVQELSNQKPGREADSPVSAKKGTLANNRRRNQQQKANQDGGPGQKRQGMKGGQGSGQRQKSRTQHQNENRQDGSNQKNTRQGHGTKTSQAGKNTKQGQMKQGNNASTNSQKQPATSQQGKDHQSRAKSATNKRSFTIKERQ